MKNMMKDSTSYYKKIDDKEYIPNKIEDNSFKIKNETGKIYKQILTSEKIIRFEYEHTDITTNHRDKKYISHNINE
jgi:hypothetical protein